MKKTKILTLVLVMLIVFNTGVAFAGTATEEFDQGFKNGQALATENKGKDIPAYTAWLAHKNSGDKASDLEHEESYEAGFMAGYKNEPVDKEEEKEKVVAYGKTLGSLLGNIYGTRDFQDGTKPNWEKAIPNDRTLARMFNLDVETSEYRISFLDEFKSGFEEAYLVSYEKAKFEPIKTSLEQGMKDGENLGKLLASTFGAKDYYEKKNIDFTRNLPSDRDIVTDYSLNGDTDEYKAGFLAGFKRMYEEEYNKVFREANINETIRDEGDAYTNGKAVGTLRGDMAATDDYMNQRLNDWKRSVLKEDVIITEYNLSIQSPNYRSGFIGGFYDGYSDGYQKAFKKFAQDGATGKVNSAIIPISGGNLMSLDNAMNIVIDQGTYYHPVNLTIDTGYNYNSQIASSFIKASDSYRVNVLNTSQNIDNKKQIDLQFEYYGDKIKGGIYKLVNNTWMYLPTTIEDGLIRTYINPASINGTYSVFVDSNVIVLPDARGHWAKDEINTYVRRHIIFGYSDNTFKPNKDISRAEFLTILGRTYGWNTEFYNFGNASMFNDYETFGTRAGIINYASALGYISGYPDGSFKPNDPISYKEVEIIMRRVVPNFNWSDISTKMLYDKKVRSSSIDNINNKITRAEVIYMFYIENENKL